MNAKISVLDQKKSFTRPTGQTSQGFKSVDTNKAGEAKIFLNNVVKLITCLNTLNIQLSSELDNVYLWIHKNQFSYLPS